MYQTERIKHPWIHLLTVLFFVFTTTNFSFADDFNDTEEEEEEIITDPLTAQLYLKSDKVPAGAQTQLEITMNLVEGYRAYLDKFKLVWDGPEDVKIGKLDIGPIFEFEDTFSGKMKKGVTKTSKLKTIIEFPSNMKTGKRKASFLLTYQACTDKHCLFPKKMAVNAPIVITDADATAAATNNDLENENSGGFFSSIGKAFRGELSFTEAVAEGVFFSFVFIFLAGILTSLTPCVYPMIPITLAVIGAKSKGQSKAKSLSMSIVYVLGIAFTFSSLGVVAALTGSLFGSALSSPLVVGVLAAIFVILGLSMYGLFELQAPAALRNMGSSKKETGYFGAFFAGLVSGIVAGPCVGPVLIGVLAYVGEKQDAVYGFSLLFTYALGMGMLFIVLGTSSSMLNKLPRAGGWMDGVKFLFGTTMIGMALYYVAPLANDRLFDALMAIALICISSAFGAFAAPESLNGFGRIKKGVLLTTFIIGVVFALQAVFGANFLSGGGGGPVAAIKAEKLDWIPYSDEALAQAQEEGKPVIIDFFAEWCVACKELEMLTFPVPEVKELSKKFALLKFDATEDSEELVRLKKKYKILGLPTLLFIDADGEVKEDLTLTGFEEAEPFAERMRKTL